MLVSWQRVKVVTRTTIKMASGVQDITCVFVEVAGGGGGGGGGDVS